MPQTFKSLVLALAVLFAGFASTARVGAAEPYRPVWMPEFDRLNALSGTERCKKLWDFLWPRAKDGDLDARQALFWTVSGAPMHMDVIIPPGRTGKEAERVRDSVILLAHSLGSPLIAGEDVQIYRDMFARGGIAASGAGAAFVSCAESAPSPVCTDKAVAAGVIPSFTTFAAKIDGAGTQAGCIVSDYNDGSYINAPKKEGP